LEAFVHESITSSYPPPHTCITTAALFHDYCAIYGPPPPMSLVEFEAALNAGELDMATELAKV